MTRLSGVPDGSLKRKVVAPTTDERGDEVHPAFALIGAARVSSNPGASLFDSDIRHGHYVVVTLRRAARRRSLNRDWVTGAGQDELFEIAMSEAQWASFVSTMNVSDGVPCTLRRVGDELLVPGIPHEPRLGESMKEVRDAGEKALARIREAFAEVEAKPNKGNIRALRAAIENAPRNMEFAAESLAEHAENVVQKARVDVESFVLSKAEQLGIDPSEVGDVVALEAGEQEQS